MSGLGLDNSLRGRLLSMLRIRMIEEAIAARYSDQEMRCPVHLSVGQEAVAVGVCAALRPSDQIVSSHRCHAHYLAKGGDLDAMIAEIHGKATGCTGGRGGSMHLMDASANVFISLPIIASSIPLGVGLALSYHQRQEDHVAVIFLGDGATEEGVFHESMNFAALHKLPVVFVLENNLYAVYANLEQRQPKRPLTDLATAHGMPAEHADGNDVEAVNRTAAEAVARARRGDGPTLLVYDTYRWREHCGPNYDNDIGYRTEAEFEAWRQRCPIETLRSRLLAEGQMSAADETLFASAVEAEIDAAFAKAKAAPFPDPATAGDYVYA